MEPIRILQVVGRMDRGGIETMIMNLYRNIDRTKIQFDFLCHYGKEADYNDEIRALGGKIYEMPRIKSTEKTYYHKFFEYKKALNVFFKDHDEYKVLHGHMTNTASIYMPISKKYGVNWCIAHSHLTKATKGLTGIMTNILQTSIEKKSDDYFSCSEIAAEWLFSKKLIHENKVKILTNAIDSEIYDVDEGIRNQYRNLFQLDNQFVIGHIGRFFQQKNHDFLIDIFAEIVKKKSNCTLVLVGEGVLKQGIEDKVKRLNLADKVKFIGVRSDVPQILQAFDVFVMPSHFEGLPVVGVEAQASGLNCIVSDPITKELDITSNVKFLSLSLSAEKWATEVLNFRENVKRISTKEKIIKSGYDVKANAKWLENYYINKHNE